MERGSGELRVVKGERVGRGAARVRVQCVVARWSRQGGSGTVGVVHGGHGVMVGEVGLRLGLRAWGRTRSVLLLWQATGDGVDSRSGVRRTGGDVGASAGAGTVRVSRRLVRGHCAGQSTDSRGGRVQRAARRVRATAVPRRDWKEGDEPVCSADMALRCCKTTKVAMKKK